MKVYAIRGAITVNENDKEEILSKTALLLKQMLEQNTLQLRDIISVIFTATNDIDAVYPAAAARELGMTDIPLLCFQEMHVAGSLPLCIRIMMHVQPAEDREMHAVYLEKAASLRPDLAGRNPAESISRVPARKFNIAIDGPAGAGKSTIAKMLAKKLDILYLDTGAMYRAIGLKVLESGKDPEKPSDVIPLLDSTDILVEYENGSQRVYLDGRDITDKIRTQQISGAASAVAVIPEVRRKLVSIQRKIASRSSLVMDGRDIGTYVLPHADLKIFLTASPEERARRRWEELRQKGTDQEYHAVLQEIVNRDHNDSSRSISPLKRAEDAALIDTTNNTIDEVITEIESLLQALRG
jgi:cytidylate kinase